MPPGLRPQRTACQLLPWQVQVWVETRKRAHEDPGPQPWTCSMLLLGVPMWYLQMSIPLTGDTPPMRAAPPQASSPWPGHADCPQLRQVPTSQAAPPPRGLTRSWARLLIRGPPLPAASIQGPSPTPKCSRTPSEVHVPQVT